VRAAGAAHTEHPYPCAVVHPNLLLLSVETHPLANDVLAALAPDIEWHLKADDEDALVQLLGPLPERVLPSKLQQHINLAQLWLLLPNICQSSLQGRCDRSLQYVHRSLCTQSDSCCCVSLIAQGHCLESYLVKTTMLSGIVVRWEVVPEGIVEVSVTFGATYSKRWPLCVSEFSGNMRGREPYPSALEAAKDDILTLSEKCAQL